MPKKREAPPPEFYDHVQPPPWREPHPIGRRGVVGPLNPGRVEALQRKRDEDRARWLGVD